MLRGGNLGLKTMTFSCRTALEKCITGEGTQCAAGGGAAEGIIRHLHHAESLDPFCRISFYPNK